MLALRPFFFLLIAACSFLMGGCYYSKGYSRQDPDLRQLHLGKVRIEIVKEPIPTEQSPTTVAETHVASWTREVLEKIPGATVTDASQPADAATTLCRVTLGSAYRSLSIGIPQLWNLRTDVWYDIEFIDIATGKRLFKAVRHAHFGGFLNLVPPVESAHLYKRDLTFLMRSATLPPPSSQANLPTRTPLAELKKT